MVIVQDPVKNLGQYFTPQSIAQFMVKLITKQDSIDILEPAAGTGIFVSCLEKDFTSITAIEIDSTLPSSSKTVIRYENFFDLSPDEKFHVVIGNPPYVRWRNQPQAIRKEIIQRKFWNNRLNALSDMMQAFIFKAIEHLHDNGELIFLTPKFWLETLHATNLRQFIVETGFIDLIVDFSETKLFSSVSSNLIIFRFLKARMPSNNKIKVFTFVERQDKYEKDLQQILNLLNNQLSIEQFQKNSHLDYFEAFHPGTSQSWKLYSETDSLFVKEFETSCTVSSTPIKEKNHSNTSSHNESYITIADIFEIGNGMVSGLDKAFWIEKNPIMKKKPSQFTEYEQRFIKKVVKARHMEQYTVSSYADYIFIEESDFASSETFKEQCPNLYALLEPFKKELSKRWSVKPVPWYVWSFPRNQAIFENYTHKFFLPCKERYNNKGFIRCVYESANIFGVQDITVLGLKDWVKESPEFILAYINSELLYKWLLIKGLRRGGVFQFSEHPLSSVPVRLINWQDNREIQIHDQITTFIRTLKNESDKQVRAIIKQKIEKLLSELFKEN